LDIHYETRCMFVTSSYTHSTNRSLLLYKQITAYLYRMALCAMFID